MNYGEIDILLVEDSPADAKMTKRAFSQSKIANTLNIVEDGEQALDYLFKRKKYGSVKRPDLILLDLNLPKIDGRELLKIVKEDTSLLMIPVIVLTTSSSDEDVLKTYSLHANSFVTKPVDLDGLIQIINSIDSFWFKIVKLPSKGGE